MAAPLDDLDGSSGRELVEGLLEVRAGGVIREGVVAEERDFRLELRDFEEERRVHLRLRVEAGGERRARCGGGLAVATDEEHLVADYFR